MIGVEEISTKLCLQASRQGAEGKKIATTEKKKHNSKLLPKLPELLFPLDYQKLNYFSSIKTMRKQ